MVHCSTEELKELTKTQDLLAKELEEVEKEESKPLIMAELITENAMEAPFLLQYQENSASWAPKYEVRFAGTNQPLAVSMKAKINQTSKEDWKQVKVTLFTGNPVSTETIPDLNLNDPPKMVHCSTYSRNPLPDILSEDRSEYILRQQCSDNIFSDYDFGSVRNRCGCLLSFSHKIQSPKYSGQDGLIRRDDKF